MKKHLDTKTFVTWKVSRGFAASLFSFVAGFVVAWLIWAQTAAYIFALMRP
jgi:membrane-bound metal-dependent hydrolase YbcI (DUF457 family)